MSGKEELLRLCGSMEQLAWARPVIFQDGRAAGLRCVLVKNGPLEFALLQDKCLDPAWISYKGINLTFLTKPGLQGRGPWDTAGAEAARAIMCGGMMTCGLEHVHGWMEWEGKAYPTHGRMRSTPAEKVGVDARFVEESYRIAVTGEMREAEIFGENLVLRRRVETEYGKAELIVADEIENQAFRREPVCLLYHCNFGYPLLSPESRVILPSLSCTPRDGNAHTEGWDRMEPPADSAPEQVFLHRCGADSQGNTFGAVVNDRLELALCIHWNTRLLPWLTQWKSTAAGDYAMALEPTNTGLRGRAEAGDRLAPLERLSHTLRFSVVEGKPAIKALEAACERLREMGETTYV